MGEGVSMHPNVVIFIMKYIVYVGLLTILSHTRKILQTVIFHFLSPPRYNCVAFELT